MAGTSPSNFTGPPSPRMAVPPARSAPAPKRRGESAGEGVGDEGPPRAPGGVLVDGEGGVGREEAEVELGAESPGEGGWDAGRGRDRVPG